VNWPELAVTPKDGKNLPSLQQKIFLHKKLFLHTSVPSLYDTAESSGFLKAFFKVCPGVVSCTQNACGAKISRQPVAKTKNRFFTHDAALESQQREMYVH